MTKNEIRKKKAKQRKKMIASLALIAVGLILVITAAVMEASHYPWGLMFGTATQDAAAIADPSPIELEPEDQDVIITGDVESPDIASPDVVSPDASASETPESSASPSAGAELPGNTADTAAAPAVTKFVVLGTLKIPVLNVSQNLLEGSGKQMKYGVGHITSTAAVGQKGNCAVSAHRPYPFRYLDKLKAGDSVVIKTNGMTYTYSVYESFDVLPTEVWVLNNIPGEDYTLTLITCTPYLVSSHRLIVRARLIDIDGKSPEEYYGAASPDVSPTGSAEPGVIETPSPAETPASTDASTPTEDTAALQSPTSDAAQGTLPTDSAGAETSASAQG